MEARRALSPPDDRPLLIFLAGPNGSGKSTFYEQHLAALGLVFINADYINRLLPDVPRRDELAQQLADVTRAHLLTCHISFATETVFSDPVGAKLAYLKNARKAGFRVHLIFVGVPSPQLCNMRVQHRVANGGHTVDPQKLGRRYTQSMLNLDAALSIVNSADIIDNSESQRPHRLIARFEAGQLIALSEDLSPWFSASLREFLQREGLHTGADLT